MAITLTEEQELLRESITRFLEREYDFAARRRVMEADSFSAANWLKFAELGWLGACLDEAAGGYGGPVETLVLMQGFGRNLVLEPVIETAIVGGQLLAALPSPRRETLLDEMIAGNLQLALATTERRSRFDLADITTTAVRRGTGWALFGAKTMVANGSRAGLIFVTARTGGDAGAREGVSLFLLAADTPGLARRSLRTHDGRIAAEITLDSALVGADALVGSEGQGLPIVEAAIEHGCAALCAEAVGSCDHVLAATIAYLKTREQYGAPLAKLQVLQHRIAEMYVATEQARVMAGLAAEALTVEDLGDRAARIDAARVAVIGYSRFVTQQAVQLHGGMGVSEELDIAHHLKRNMVAGIQFGNEAHHLERFSASRQPRSE
jgi:alkylation response protein AidB-like acyl-CoA dehydrogenase